MKYQRTHPSTQESNSDKPNFAQETYLCALESSLQYKAAWEGRCHKQDNALKGNYDTQYIQMAVIVILIIQSIQGTGAFYDYNHSKKDKYKVISIQSY